MRKSKERFLSFTLSSKTKAASMKIAMTLTAAAVFAMSPVVPAVVGTEITVQAADYKDSTDANIKFTVNEDGKTATIIDYTGSASSLTIPETVSYGGVTYTVTEIGDEAFGAAHGYTDLTTTEIVIGGNIKTIGNSAFEGSSSIEKITIQNGVESIGERAFYGLTNLKEITFPESVVSIGPNACTGATNLEKVTILGNISENCFGSSAFKGCTKLKTVDISGSVKEIPSYAFSGCELLTSLTIPNDVTSIDNNAFESCASLASIDIPEKVTYIGSYAFNGTGLTSIVIPKKVTTIGNSAFGNCTALESAVINGKITEVPNSLFDTCVNLVNVKLPAGITEIGAYAFYNNFALKNIAIGRSGVDDTTLVIPNSVTSIGKYAFACEEIIDDSSYYKAHNNKFSFVNLGNGLSSLGVGAFAGFSTDIIVTSPELITIPKEAFYAAEAKEVYITRCQGDSSADLNVVIKADAFKGCKIEKLYLPYTIRLAKNLGADCFESEVGVIDNIYTDATDNTKLTKTNYLAALSSAQRSCEKIWYSSDSKVSTIDLSNIIPKMEDHGTEDVLEEIHVTGVSLDKVAVELTEEDTTTLTATVTPDNATNTDVTWTSSNPEVATVDAEGKVTAVAAGTATITVTTADEEMTATCAVTVKAATVSVTGVSLDKAAVELTEGDTTTLTATVTPDNATKTDVTWSSTNPSVATVDAEGKVTAVAAGTAIITVTTDDEAKTATCTVTVTAKTTEIENFVDRLYTNLLNQSVDATEKASLVNSLSAQTTTAADAVAKFALSDSIADISNAEFVSRMYRAVFNRDADDGGRVTWENLLNNGMSRKIVIQKFTESEEFANICASCGMTQGEFQSDEIRDSNILVTSFVNNLYLTILGRTPDVAGINNFVGALLNGASTDGIVKEFILGAEYKSKNYTNEEFIIACFRGILGRTETTIDTINGGKLFLDTLNAEALTREGIVDSLLDSQEYLNRLNAHGLTKDSTK